MRTRLVGGVTLIGLVCALLIVLSRTDLGGADARPVAAAFDKKHARYFNLPDGKAQIGVSIVKDRFVTVRWRDPDGKTWTAAEMVYAASDRLTHEYMQVRVVGPTLALYATYMPLPEDVVGFDDGYPPGVVGSTVYVVCRDGDCATSRLYDDDPGRAPQITPDGDRVFLGRHGDVYVSWDGGDIAEQRVSGLPEGDYGDTQPLLTPDGSLRAVSGVARPGGCEFTLLATESGEASFTPVVTHQDTGDTRRRCTSTVQSYASDYVVVVGRSKYRPWFAEATDAGWRTVTDDPSGQVRYPRVAGAKLAGTFTQSGFWHWRLVLGTSPDGRSLVVQVHRPGEERWGPPQVVARAPAGSECLEIVPKPTYTWDEEDPFYISLEMSIATHAGRRVGLHLPDRGDRRRHHLAEPRGCGPPGAPGRRRQAVPRGGNVSVVTRARPPAARRDRTRRIGGLGAVGRQPRPQQPGQVGVHLRAPGPGRGAG